MQADARAVRRAYELGRLKTSLRRALYVVVPFALVTTIVTGREALVWLPVTFAIWTFAHFRGEALLRGAFFGLAGGIVTYLLPLSILRPCCSPEAMTAAAAAGRDCCTMPGACLLAGGLIGFTLAAFVPVGKDRVRTALGMALGVASVAVLKCATLFGAEALGLVGGVLAGVLGATVARRLFVKPST